MFCWLQDFGVQLRWLAGISANQNGFLPPRRWGSNTLLHPSLLPSPNPLPLLPKLLLPSPPLWSSLVLSANPVARWLCFLLPRYIEHKQTLCGYVFHGRCPHQLLQLVVLAVVVSRWLSH